MMQENPIIATPFHHRYLDQAVDWMIEHTSSLLTVDPLSSYEGKGWRIYREGLGDQGMFANPLSPRYIAEVDDQQLATAFRLRFG